jgi:uncharacterized protein (TIGR03435 family)
MMPRTLLLTALAVLTGCHGHLSAQSPTFEVASIKPCPPGTPAPHPGSEEYVLPSGRFQAKAARVSDLFEWAYGIQPPQHARVPAPFDRQLFDVVAQAGEKATEAEMRLMVRALLADRFHFQFHTEKRELPVFIWSRANQAPQLTASKPGDSKGLRMSRQAGPEARFVTTRVEGTRFRIADLAAIFSLQFDRPILDQTGLAGEYDFTLDLTLDQTQPQTIDSSMLITALNEQLHLKMKADKAVVDYHVIDGVEAPTAD